MSRGGGHEQQGSGLQISRGTEINVYIYLQTKSMYHIPFHMLSYIYYTIAYILYYYRFVFDKI